MAWIALIVAGLLETGIGALGAAIGGIILFREPVTPLRMLFLALLLISIVGLRFTSSGKRASRPQPPDVSSGGHW